VSLERAWRVKKILHFFFFLHCTILEFDGRKRKGAKSKFFFFFCFPKLWDKVVDIKWLGSFFYIVFGLQFVLEPSYSPMVINCLVGYGDHLY
jgi:hypothetical protein